MSITSKLTEKLSEHILKELIPIVLNYVGRKYSHHGSIDTLSFALYELCCEVEQSKTDNIHIDNEDNLYSIYEGKYHHFEGTHSYLVVKGAILCDGRILHEDRSGKHPAITWEDPDGSTGRVEIESMLGVTRFGLVDRTDPVCAYVGYQSAPTEFHTLAFESGKLIARPIGIMHNMLSYRRRLPKDMGISISHLRREIFVDVSIAGCYHSKTYDIKQYSEDYHVWGVPPYVVLVNNKQKTYAFISYQNLLDDLMLTFPKTGTKPETDMWDAINSFTISMVNP